MSLTDDRPAVLVTGASRGLGAHIAHRLALEGYRVFAGVRQPGATMPRHDQIIPTPLDVTEPRSITAALELVSDRLAGRGLFALVNNAAVLRAAPLELASIDSVDRQVRTNVIGPLAVTQAFLPQLRTPPGRILNVSSVNAFLPLPFWGVYSATKAALVALSDALRMELAPWGIPVSVLTLGAFATDIRSRAHAEWVTQAHSGGAHLYRPALEANRALVATLDSMAGDPAEVTDAVVGILRAETPPARCNVGDGVDDLLALAAQPVDVRDAALAQLLPSAADRPAR